MLFSENEFNSEFDKMFIEQIIAGIVYPEVQKQLQAEDKKWSLRKPYKW